MRVKEINWFALVGGILLLVLIPASLYFSWWQMIIGEDLLIVNASPVNTSFGLMGTALIVPLIWALNVIGILSLSVSGIVMLIYSVIPAKPYSMDLLSFGYRKPLYMVIFFVVGLLATTLLAQSLFGVGIPLSGTSSVVLPSSLTMGADVSVVVFTAFQWPFYLAVVAAGICIVARFYHRRVSLEAMDALRIRQQVKV